MNEIPIVRILIVLDAEEIGTRHKMSASNVARCYLHFRDMNADVVFASEHGGFPEVAGAMRNLHHEPAVHRFLQDTEARNDLADTLPLDRIFVEDFDVAVLFYGSSRPSTAVMSILSALVSAGRTVVLPPAADTKGFSGPGLVVVRNPDDELEWIPRLFPSDDQTEPSSG